jgi:hypothetical protein
MKKLILLCLLVLSFTLMHAQKKATKMVLMEEVCGKNCGPCSRHCLEVINPLYGKYKNQIAMVVYNQAPIGVGTWGEMNKPYRAFGDAFGLGYQSEVMMDRTFFPNNYNIQDGPVSEGVESEPIAFNELFKMDYVPVSVNISNTYNASTRAVDINVTANFCDSASGDLRIYLVLTQDTVKGPNNTYDYAHSAMDKPGSVIGGLTVETLPAFGDPAYWCFRSFPFINVVKYQPSGFFGNAGIIPKKPVIGQSYTENFSFKLPVKNATSELIDIDPKRIQIVAAVVRSGQFKKRQVLNTNKKYLISNVTSVDESIANGIVFNVTNPVSNSILLNYSATQEGAGKIFIYNASGEIIRTIENVVYDQSVSSKTIDVSDLSGGIYFVSLQAAGAAYTRKVIIAR